MGRRLTAQEKAERNYNRKVAKIEKRYEKLKSKGFVLPSLQSILPSVPKSYSTKKLEKYSSSYIASKGFYVSRETGKTVKGKKGYKKYRSEAVKFPKKKTDFESEIQEALQDFRNRNPSITQPTIDTILSEPVGDMIKYLLDYIDSMPSKIYNGANMTIIEGMKDELGNIIERNISTFGYKEYETYLSDREEQIVNLCDVTEPYQKQGIDQAKSHITELSQILDNMIDLRISQLESDLSDSYGEDEIE